MTWDAPGGGVAGGVGPAKGMLPGWTGVTGGSEMVTFCRGTSLPFACLDGLGGADCGLASAEGPLDEGERPPVQSLKGRARTYSNRRNNRTICNNSKPCDVGQHARAAILCNPLQLTSTRYRYSPCANIILAVVMAAWNGPLGTLADSWAFRCNLDGQEQE